MTPARASHDLPRIAAGFAIAGEFLGAEPYGSGHINDTYAARYDQAGTVIRYIHQRINHHIFKRPEALMENIARVTAHQKTWLQRQSASSDLSRRCLSLIPDRAGRPYFLDADGNYWRTYQFIEKARTYDAVQNPRQAYEAARAFGAFQSMLVDLPAPRLHETIPQFHDTRARFQALQQMIERDPCNRAAGAAREIAFVEEREHLTGMLLDLLAAGELPERITHNDTKLNNVMIDDATSEGICVIDLDTVMPGLVLYDFGDMVRTATSPASEDERDLRKVVMQMPMFQALAKGYLESAGSFLTRLERSLLGFSGKLITLEIGIRFLTDHLAGDTYFKIHREHHNLDRCRAQFKLVSSIEEQQEAMQKTVEELSATQACA